MNLSLSDKNVVKKLIVHRNEIDFLYNTNTSIDINRVGDTYEMSQNIIALYASLDMLIEQCKFNERHLKLLNLIFEGNLIQDICNMNIGYGRSATYDLFDRIVDRIVDKNNDNWRKSIKKDV